jgi:hypothetical protein
LHAEGEPCSSATLVNYHLPYYKLIVIGHL